MSTKDIVAFLSAIMVNVVAYYICKWLDDRKK
jgi:hypothetical protein